MSAVTRSTVMRLPKRSPPAADSAPASPVAPAAMAKAERGAAAPTRAVTAPAARDGHSAVPPPPASTVAAAQAGRPARAVGAQSSLDLRLAQARAGSASSVEATADARARPTLASIERALVAAEAHLEATRPRSGLEDLLEHPLDAFFGVKDMVQVGETWRDLFGRVELTQAQLDASEQAPLSLSPMPVLLYKGTVFPDAYFMRSTMYWNEVRGGLSRVGTFDIEKLTRRMPWIDLRGSEAGGASLAGASGARLHEVGGSARLLALLKEVAGGASHVMAYRGCARSELDVQRLLRDLAAQDPGAPLTKDERARLAAIGTTHGDGLAVEVAQVAAGFAVTDTRAEVIQHLAQMLGGMNQATFVGFDRAKAEEFRDPDDEPNTGAAAEIIVTYRLPLDELERHVASGRLFLGAEFSALEAGFGHNSADPTDHSTKLLLFRSIVEEPVTAP